MLFAQGSHLNQHWKKKCLGGAKRKGVNGECGRGGI
jgi:hypothetical protein